ncbi:MAG: hypothetical protein JOZ99_06670 [Actinobacteria bacterium]|nr:hypothetical protein [Actinomycetota bacterium]
MGGVALVAVAMPIGATLALFALLALGVVALQLARRVRDDDGPLFPDAPAIEHDPVRYTEGLAKGGSFADDTARFAEVAAHAGFDQAYSLLTMATDGRSNGRQPSRGRIAALATLDDDDRRLAAFFAASPAVPAPQSPTGAPTIDPAIDATLGFAEHAVRARASNLAVASPDQATAVVPEPTATSKPPEPVAPVAEPSLVGAAASGDDDLLPGRRWRRRHAA